MVNQLGRLKKALSILLVFTCLLQVFSVSLPVLAETSEETEIYSSSLDGIEDVNDTDWEYVLINGEKEIKMTYGAFASGGNTYYGRIVPRNEYVDSKDSNARFMANGGSHPAYSGDTAAVHKVQQAGKLDLTLKVSVTSSSSDGVQVKIYKNSSDNILQTATVVAGAAGTKTFTVKGVSVEAGDRLYFTLNMNDGWGSDGGTFEAVVETAKINTTSIDGIVENNQTNWSYVLIDKTTGTETAMSYGTYTNTPAMLINTTTNDQHARFLNNGYTHPAYSGDTAAVYTVDKAGYLDCSLQVRFKNTTDGVNVKIWVNSKAEYLLIPTQVSSATGEEVLNYEVPGVYVNAGDKIYFALDYNTSFNSDGGHFVARVKTGKKLAVDKSYSGNIMASQADYGYSYVHITDDGKETSMSYAAKSGNYVYMNGLSGKAYAASSNATAFFNDKYQAGSASAGTSAQVYTVQADGKLTVRLSAKANNPTTFARGDGIGIAIALNDCVMGGLDNWTYLTATEGGAGTEKSIQKEINVKAGDKIYFLCTKNGGEAGTYGNGQDVAIFKTSVTYTEIREITEIEHTVGTIGLVLAGATYQSHAAIAEKPKNGFSFVRIDKYTNTIHPLVYDNGYMRVTDAQDSSDYYGSFGNNYSGSAAANCDVAVVYTAPAKMNVDITAHGKFGAGGGNGVNTYVYKNNFNFKLGEHYFAPEDEIYKYVLTDVTLDKGDRVFIVLNNNGSNSYDAGSFSTLIKCNSVNPDGAATTPDVPSHNGEIDDVNKRIYLTATTVGNLIDSFTDESFVNVKADGEYLTRYATIKTGDTVVIDDVEYTAIIFGDANANGKTDRLAENSDIEILRNKLVGNELTELEALALANDTDSTALVRRIKEVSKYADMSFAPITLQTTETFELTSGNTTTETLAINRSSSEFGTVRISLNNTSDTNYGKLYYKTASADNYNSVPFYFGEGEETVSVPLTTTTLFAGTIESMYLEVPAITEGTVSGTVKIVSESKYREMNTQEEQHLVILTDSTSKTAKVVDLNKFKVGETITLTEENTIWTSMTIDIGIDDAKLRHSNYHNKDVVITTSSSGDVRIHDYEDGETIWCTNLGTDASPHSIEMLPNGDVVIACSGNDASTSTEINGKILYYKVGTEGWSNTSTISLKSAHGVVWDEENEVIWALGMDGLTAYQVSEDGLLTQKTGMGVELTACGGHALSTDYQDSNYLWITTAVDKVLKFDKTKNQVVSNYTYSDMAIDSTGRTLANAVHVKGITSFEDGTVVFCKPNGSGETSSTLCVIDSMGLRTYVFDNVAIYKVNKYDAKY